MVTKNEQQEVPELPLNGVYDFNGEHNVVRFVAQWTTRSFGIICDLELHAYCYDERARFIERLDVTTKRTQDQALVLVTDGESGGTASNIFTDVIKIDFRLIDASVAAVLFVLDGGSKYFQLVQQMEVNLTPLNAGKVSMPGQAQVTSLVTFSEKARKENQAAAMAVLFRDGWMEEDATRAQWKMRALMTSIEVTTKRAKDDKLLSIVVGFVPSLEKYKPRLFGSVRDLCSALSSLSLPKLKQKFLAMPGGLDITTFTEVIFMQLYETHPLITEPSECAYTVSMIQEMFQQIDYNGDGGADWDEFTTFCIQTASQSNVIVQSMDEYVIEYSEDITLREKKSTAFRPCATMKYFPAAGRFVIIPDEQDRIQILDKKFKTRSVLRSDNMIIKSATGAKKVMERVEENSAKVLIYDVVYLTGRDMYAFSASDHGISVCKEQGSVGSKKVNIILYTKIFHSQLFLKLCWSASSKILCSVASDRTIFGWDIDKTTPIFQVSRHSDVITDFISADSLDCFITCSMDKRIVMWSAHTRRVKGIMVGHKRGVRSLSLYETTLLSAGYELDARTWDLNSKENVAILRGHRAPIVDAKLMCDKALSDRDYRAITVDESGEMRLWNIFVMERASDPVDVPTLQMFGMLNPEYPMKYLKCIAIPYEPLLSQSYYSDVVACGTKMMHFVPEKNVKEFIPPSAGGFNEPAAEFVTAVSKNLLKYDVCTGLYVGAIGDFSNNADITCLSIETPRGRRIFIGCGNGDLLLVNYMSGQIIDLAKAHLKEVTCLATSFGARNQLFTGSIDGRLVMTEETDGELYVRNTVEKAFGDLPSGLPVGIVNVKLAEAVGACVVQGAGTMWGIWGSKNLKRILIFSEPAPVMSFEVIGCTGDEEELAKIAKEEEEQLKTPSKKSSTEELHLLTLAVASSAGIRIYTADIAEAHGCCTHVLQYDKPIYMTSLTMLKTPEGESVNYAAKSNEHKRIRLGLVGTTDEGKVAIWEIEGVRWESQRWLLRKFPAHTKSTKTPPQPTHSPSRPTSPGSPEREESYRFMHDSPPSPKDYRLGTATTGSRPATGSLDDDEGLGDLHGGASIHSLSSSKINSTHIESIAFFGPPIGRRGILSIPCHLIWVAHLDSVCIAVPMHEHGCLLTGSHDGFQRVWNMDRDCMGELLLPNLTNKMKHPSKPIFATPMQTWKFILEKIPINQEHRDLAEYLVRVIRANERGDGRRSTHVDAAMIASMNISQFGEEEEEEKSTEEILTPQERLRKDALEAMVAPVKMPEDGPPLQIPSRADRRLAAIADALESHKQQQEQTQKESGFFLTAAEDHADDFFLPSITTHVSKQSRALHSPVPGSSPISRATTPKRTPKSSVKKSLYYAAGEGVTDKAFAVPAAFSITSLIDGANEEILDDEGLLLLQRFSRTSAEKIEQYEASGSTILLRRPELSTSITLPDLHTMRRAEIAFGEQKDFYKNAERELNANDKLKKDKMRDAITISRIEQNVKRMSSMMMSVVTPIAHDDIKIPNQQEAYQEMMEKDEKDNFRMKIRLMQSSSLVSLEAREKARPLDKDGLQRLAEKVARAEREDAEHDKRYAKRDKRKGKKEILEPTAKEALIKKVRNAIRDEYLQKNRAEIAAAGDTSLDEFFSTSPRGSPTAAGIMGSASATAVSASPRAPSATALGDQLDGVDKPLTPQLSFSSTGSPFATKRKASATSFAQDVKGGNSPGPGTPTSERTSTGIDLTPDHKGAALFIDAASTAHIRSQNTPSSTAHPRSAPGTASSTSGGTAPGTAASSPSNRGMSSSKGSRGGTGTSGTTPGTAASSASQGRQMLTTRMLLPFYKLDDVVNFLDIFAKVDANFSGNLDMDEWTSLFKSLGTNIPAQEARSIFMKFKNDEGFLSMRELVPVVFGRASKDQQRLIIQYCNSEMVKKSESVTQLTFNEIDQLFESYDVNNFGFVAVSYIRDQIRSLVLPEPCIISCLNNFRDIDDDEMVNPQEFTRFFRVYLSTQELLAQKKEELHSRFHAN